MQISRSASEMLHRIEGQFEMTPSARASITLSDDMLPDRQSEFEV